MNFFWVYEMTNWQLFISITAIFVLVGTLGFLITQRSVEAWLGPTSASNDMVSGFIQLIGVFYGITLGLVAVATWGNFNAAKAVLSKEASLLGCMYKCAEGFPDPIKTEIKNEIREITRYTIEVAWPIQQRGEIPKGGRTTKLENMLYTFNPKTEGDKIVLSKELDLLFSMVEIRRERKENISSGLPKELYEVLFVGAFINIAMTWFLVGTKRSLHIIITTLACILISSLIFLIITMDFPYYGEFSVTPDAYKIIYNDVMRK